ncbi:MAG TPA: tRNA pseudouridine(55) synthase TruB [Candidatus Limnocylindrales bacterium]|nr:tRNA pseudouridine(55) synthase TruB [Candidatus Limnocylindrales bacterium]
MDGVIVVDKPQDWTSHDVVNRMRRIANTKKVGHLGTLDPIATGVLPLIVGRATRLAQFYTHSDKIYEGVVRFGFSTNTYDRAGDPTSEPVEPSFSDAALEAALDRFRGEFKQTPPPVSAKKVAGKRAYELARKNIAVELAPVPVHVYEAAVLERNGSEVRIRVHCSGGTYVRSIAHDAGQLLGCGAHLKELRRVASGEFEAAQARTLQQLESLAAEERLIDALVPMGDLLPGFTSVFVDDLTATQIRNGRNFPASPFRSQPASRFVKAVTRQNELVAIGEAVLPNLYHPAVVL